MGMFIEVIPLFTSPLMASGSLVNDSLKTLTEEFSSMFISVEKGLGGQSQQPLDAIISGLPLPSKSLITMLSFVHMLGPHKVRHIHMKYYLLDVKRVLDGDTYFDKEEVNGGSCWSGPDECSITVWRKEEVLKVSIHELIHGLHYDYKQDTLPIVQHYQQKYSIRSPKMNTFEAYTEIHAVIASSFASTIITIITIITITQTSRIWRTTLKH